MMASFLWVILLTAVQTIATQNPPAPAVAAATPAVTFYKDVLPVLQQHCQVCHRPGEIGPVSFMTYESTRPWAKAIKEAVVTRKMPPWLADSHFGGFRNAPTLAETDIRTLATWADSGAPQGDVHDKPDPVKWMDGWRTKPDVVVSMPEPHAVPAKGAGEIKSFFVANPFKEDTWVTSIEVRPGDPSVVHHVIVQIDEPTGREPAAWGQVSCLVCSTTAVSGRLQEKTPVAGRRREGGGGGYYGADARPEQQLTTLEAVYAPGSPPMDFQFHNAAKLIRAGTPIRIEMHYTPNGKATSDQTKVGFTLAQKPAKRRLVTLAPAAMVNKRDFRIPAGESNWESRGELTFTEEAELVWFMPHMHLRGKDMTFKLVYPNGRVETVLSAKFNFQWQLGYEVEDPIRVPKGTRMIVVAHHDNSANNPYNPDPSKDVRWGELTSEEMILPWFGVIVDRNVDPERIVSFREEKTVAPNRPMTPTLFGMPRPPILDLPVPGRK